MVTDVADATCTVARCPFSRASQSVLRLQPHDGQLCMKLGMYFVRGVFFHVLSRRDVAKGPSTWVNWDDWIPEHELPPSWLSAIGRVR